MDENVCVIMYDETVWTKNVSFFVFNCTSEC